MDTTRVFTIQEGWRRSGINAATGLVAAAAILAVDGQLGPMSFALRRGMAVTALAVIAALWTSRHGRPRVLAAAAIAAAVILARAPSVSAALVELIAAVAVIEIALGSRATGPTMPVGLVPAVCSYSALRFVADLVPQTGTTWETAAHAASGYVNRARRLDANLSFTVLGGPAVVFAFLYLLWSWRRAGGAGRLVAAGAIPAIWFGSSCDCNSRHLGRTARRFLAWLGTRSFLDDDRLNRGRRVARRAASNKSAAAGGSAARPPCCWNAVAWVSICWGNHCGTTGRVRFGRHAQSAPGGRLYGGGAGRSLPRRYGADRPRGRTIDSRSQFRRPRLGPAGLWPVRRIQRRHVRLLPVYCRAEGYDFGVIEHTRGDPPRPRHRSSPNGPNAVADARDAAVEQKLKQSASRRRRAHLRVQQRPDRGSARTAERVGMPGAAAARRVPPTDRPRRSSRDYTDAIEPADLAETQILVLINSPKEWRSADRRVDSGLRGQGRQPAGAGRPHRRLRLDARVQQSARSARYQVPFRLGLQGRRETWRGCQAAAPDLVAWGWDEENPGVAVGASLELSGNAAAAAGRAVRLLRRGGSRKRDGQLTWGITTTTRASSWATSSWSRPRPTDAAGSSSGAIPPLSRAA